MKRVVCILISLIILCGIAAPVFAEAEKVPAGYIPIRTAQELDNIRNNLSGKYILMNDIDLSGYENWVPIGTEKEPFVGILNGNNYSIRNIMLNRFISGISRSSSGLFAFVRGSQILNTNIVSANQIITSGNKAFYCFGLLAGNVYYSKITNCSSSGFINLSVAGYCTAGGIAGEVGTGSTVSNCENTSEIMVAALDEIKIGGVAGSSYSQIMRCGNKGNLTVFSPEEQKENNYRIVIGGICGLCAIEDISDSYNMGNIFCREKANIFAVGGICGESFSVKKCFNTGKIETETKDFSGGISGIVKSITDRPDDKVDLSVLQDCYCLDNIDKIVGEDETVIIKNSGIKSETELKQKNTYCEYDFENVWHINENESYPVLKKISSAEPEVQLVGANIVFVPLKNLIVFGSGAPNTPDGIVVLLRFSDGTIRFKTVKEDNYDYTAGEYDVEQYGWVTNYRTGFLFDEIVINGQFKLIYVYLSLPVFLRAKL